MCILPHTGSAGLALPVVSGSPVAVALSPAILVVVLLLLLLLKGAGGTAVPSFLPGTHSGFWPPFRIILGNQI